ncbi:Glutamate-1-semialdehyde aminotransferase [Actinokineospora spheciospongiae]|uniref:Glutamate-1-semialdehyde aminotransferase n=1 Tax=Actinokineospora spheciospongiae TaxID=909613 RepID=W7IUL6_9PSEU|nr:aminotransferase class III-fold pyridoxal phosphate-dependent enzyme [Actinokineospora spheciospongiae]EWC64610.1 Glutamate-1-semialdehyde aminotransferase [Actinokineospora spheciospongiae]
MTATLDADATQRLVSDLLTQPWVIDLFTDVATRQAGSMAQVEKLRPLGATNHAFWPFHAPQFPLSIARAKGSRITAVDGNTYLDCHLGFGAQALHGHNPEPVVAAVRDLLGTSTGNGYLHPVESELIGVLQGFLPHCEKFAFLNSGTDATAAAIRLARAHTGKRMVAKFEGSLHGVHDLAAHNTAFWYHGHPVQPFPEVGPNGVTPTPALKGVPIADNGELLVLPNDAKLAIELIERHRDQLACVLGEAVSSSFPFPEHTVPIIKATAAASRDLGIPFILDEVLTGFRYGPGGAAAHFDIPADLHTYGKVVSALGIPLSVVAGKAALIEHTQTSGMPLTDLGRKTSVQTTHAGNHLALAASLATLTLLRDQGDAYYTRTRAKVDRLRSGLAAFRAETGIPLRLLGFGDFIGSFGFTAEESYSDYRDFASAINPIALFLMTLLLRRRGVYALSLPMLFTGDAHSEADLDELFAAVTDSAREMAANDFPFILG